MDQSADEYNVFENCNNFYQKPKFFHENETVESVCIEEVELVDAPALKPKPWPLNKTKALLGIVKRSHMKFKKSNKARKIIWKEIADDMKSEGFITCDRDECSKKWDNLFRTYKNIIEREGSNGNGWELFSTVKDLVKLLKWPDPKAGFGKSSTSSNEQQSTTNSLDVGRLLKVVEDQNRDRTLCISAFEESVKILNQERDELIKRLGVLLTTNKSGVAVQNGVKETILQELRKETNGITSEKTMEVIEDDPEDVNQDPDTQQNTVDLNANGVGMSEVNISQEIESVTGCTPGWYMMAIVGYTPTGDPEYDLISVAEDQVVK